MKRHSGGEKFWNKAYARRRGSEPLKLSMDPSEDLQKFIEGNTHFLTRFGLPRGLGDAFQPSFDHVLVTR